MVNFARLMMLVALMVLGGAVMPAAIMHYEIDSGVLFLMGVCVVGLIMGSLLHRWERQSQAQAKVREHMKTSSLYTSEKGEVNPVVAYLVFAACMVVWTIMVVITQNGGCDLLGWIVVVVACVGIIVAVTAVVLGCMMAVLWITERL